MFYQVVMKQCMRGNQWCIYYTSSPADLESGCPGNILSRDAQSSLTTETSWFSSPTKVPAKRPSVLGIPGYSPGPDPGGTYLEYLTREASKRDAQTSSFGLSCIIFWCRSFLLNKNRPNCLVIKNQRKYLQETQIHRIHPFNHSFIHIWIVQSIVEKHKTIKDAVPRVCKSWKKVIHFVFKKAEIEKYKNNSSKKILNERSKSIKK